MLNSMASVKTVLKIIVSIIVLIFILIAAKDFLDQRALKSQLEIMPIYSQNGKCEGTYFVSRKYVTDTNAYIECWYKPNIPINDIAHNYYNYLIQNGWNTKYEPWDKFAGNVATFLPGDIISVTARTVDNKYSLSMAYAVPQPLPTKSGQMTMSREQIILTISKYAS